MVLLFVVGVSLRGQTGQIVAVRYRRWSAACAAEYETHPHTSVIPIPGRRAKLSATIPNTAADVLDVSVTLCRNCESWFIPKTLTEAYEQGGRYRIHEEA